MMMTLERTRTEQNKSTVLSCKTKFGNTGSVDFSYKVVGNLIPEVEA